MYLYFQLPFGHTPDEKIKALLLLTIFSVITSNTAFAGEINKSFFGTTIKGYDITAYFNSAKPTKGEKTYNHEWKDAKWLFGSEQERDLFAQTPEKFAPQYGGFCANAMSLGKKVKGDPEIWRIIDNKLYLFYAKKGRERWQSNTTQWIKDANKHWPRLKDK